MPAHVLGTIYHPCHPKAASCLSQASFAFHQPQALFPHLWRLCIAALLILNHIFQRRSLAKISMLCRKMIWIADTSLYTDCGQNKYQRLQWVVLPFGEVGGVRTASLIPNTPTWISSILLLHSKHIRFHIWLQKQFLQRQMKCIWFKCTLHSALGPVLPTPSNTTVHKVLFSSPTF